MNKLFFIDICTLFEEKYTGISNVNFFIVKHFYTKKNVYFFHLNKLVKNSVIEKILRDKAGGEWLIKYHNSGEMYFDEIENIIKSDKNNVSVGVYSNVKLILNVFDYNVQMIYDLTPIITPELHHSSTVDFHAKTIERDLKDNDLNICISESTKEDLITYLNIPENKCYVNYLASDIDINSINKMDLELFLKANSLKNYILILGTVEPRKNINMVLNYLEKNEIFLESYQVVFLGKDGWGKTFNDSIKDLKFEYSKSYEQIIHFGYLSDEKRNNLISNAKLLIYPSVYEGFGLPILEAFSLGCPVLTTFSSSMPEVGSTYADYFDPYDLDSFSKSLDNCLNRNYNREELISYSKRFSWDSFCKNLEIKINEIVDKNKI